MISETDARRNAAVRPAVTLKGRRGLMFDDSRLSFKRIVCPLDLSSDSSQALRYAVAVARSYGAKLFVLHCTAANSDGTVTDRASLKRVIENVTREYLLSPRLPALDWEAVIVSGEPEVEIAR